LNGRVPAVLNPLQKPSHIDSVAIIRIDLE
jgi:hypothetical protein